MIPDNEPRPGASAVSPADFRRLVGRFATGVTVATTLDHDGRPVGMTASSVASLSLDPPLVLVCVQRTAEFHGPMIQAAAFALNVLACEQADLSHRFSQSESDRFDGVAYHTGECNLPLLEGVVAQIICESCGSHRAGDHTIFFGRVIGGDIFKRPPLIHFDSDYTTTADS